MTDSKDENEPKALLRELALLYKFQPATAFWRAVELSAVLTAGLPEGRGMDLGCGDGALAGFLLQRASGDRTLIGLDNDPSEVEIAKRRNVYSDTICASSESVPLENDSLDFVFSNSVLEHVPAFEATIAECRRLLKPGGTFMATVPVSEFRNLLNARGLTGDEREKFLQKMDQRLGHLNYLDARGWTNLLVEHGFENVSTEGYLSGSQVQRWEKLSNRTAGLLQALGANNKMLYRLQRLSRSDNKEAGGFLSTKRQSPRWANYWAKLVGGNELEPDKTKGRIDRWGCLLVTARKAYP